ncbi:pickpocket protein 19-like [Planococcus citri]|uniref:pickpocket protein 19-like n=1 Tax=Planococcus citri TaxID=170843 RepID=UPI0031FA245D
MYASRNFKKRAIRNFVKINFQSNFAADLKDDSFWKKYSTDLCNNLSFHGLSHFVDSERSVAEKFFWGCLFVGAVIGAVTSIRLIWLNFIQSVTETVVETTYYKYSHVAFPAVIICESSRVDWSRALQLNETNVPEMDNETKPAILDLLQALAGIEFGEFDRFEVLREHKHLLPKLQTIKISDLLLKFNKPSLFLLLLEPIQVKKSCEELFIGKCWWRSHYIDCCTVFELSKSEFGYCYAFNSDLSEYSKKLSLAEEGIESYWRDPDGVLRPRRTGSRGQWSGLRVTVHTPPAGLLTPRNDIKAGLKVFVGEPRSFVMGGEITVAAGQYGNVHIWGDRLYSTDRLRLMDSRKRQCLYSNEDTALGLEYYLRQNCKMDCYKYHTYKYYNNPAYPPCTVEDLLCLSDHNSIFNNMLPPFAQAFFEPNETGMMCDCKADCTHQMYIAEITIAEESNSSHEVMLDIHFRQSTCILYRTDVTFSLLDLLVAFGGCTGLFLGGSLLSCVELLYFLTLRLYFQWKSWKTSTSTVGSATTLQSSSTTTTPDKGVIKQ